MSGKGSAPRPYSVDPETFSSNWGAIFGKKTAPPSVVDTILENPKEPWTQLDLFEDTEE